MITRNDLARFKKVLKIRYPELGRLEGALFKIGYNSGVYGWNYDVFVLGSVAIVTGYRLPGISERGFKDPEKARELVRRAAAACEIAEWRERDDIAFSLELQLEDL